MNVCVDWCKINFFIIWLKYLKYKIYRWFVFLENEKFWFGDLFKVFGIYLGVWCLDEVECIVLDFVGMLCGKIMFVYKFDLD